MMEIKCDFCGNICNKKPYEIRYFKKHFCNKECFKKFGRGEEILNLWNTYKSTKKISEILKISVKKIGRTLWGYGIRLTNNKRCELSKEFLNEEYIIKQKSCGQIAIENNFSNESIRKRLIKFNIPLRRNSFLSEWDRKRRKEANNIRYSLRDENGKCVNSSFYNYRNSDEQMNIIAESNRNNKEAHKKMSITKKKMFAEGKIIPTWKGKHFSESTKNKLRNSTINYYINNPEKLDEIRNILNKINESRKGKTYEEIYGEEKAKKLKEGISKRFKGKPPTSGTFTKESRKNLILPLQDSSIEIRVHHLLKQLGIEFFTHMWINQIKHKYRCDIFIPVQQGILKKIIIECDGDWFHGNILKYPILNKMQLEQCEEDKIRTKEMIEKGFRVIRLWESDIKVMDIDKLKNIIFEYENTIYLQ